ncbi:MAG: hypothetical protein KAR20_22000, partial [Candidatus Heimdallarchaeota archaeon]|nr:hypothetical protein [Candidatus Heimdallarchaeota archaeon]
YPVSLVYFFRATYDFNYEVSMHAEYILGETSIQGSAFDRSISRYYAEIIYEGLLFYEQRGCNIKKRKFFLECRKRCYS